MHFLCINQEPAYHIYVFQLTANRYYPDNWIPCVPPFLHFFLEYFAGFFPVFLSVQPWFSFILMEPANSNFTPAQEDNSNNQPMDTNNDQETLIYLHEEDVQEGVHICKKSIVGKILSDKPIHKGSIMTALDNIW